MGYALNSSLYTYDGTRSVEEKKQHTHTHTQKKVIVPRLSRKGKREPGDEAIIALTVYTVVLIGTSVAASRCGTIYEEVVPTPSLYSSKYPMSLLPSAPIVFSASKLLHLDILSPRPGG